MALVLVFFKGLGDESYSVIYNMQHASLWHLY